MGDIEFVQFLYIFIRPEHRHAMASCDACTKRVKELVCLLGPTQQNKRTQEETWLLNQSIQKKGSKHTAVVTIRQIDHLGLLLAFIDDLNPPCPTFVQ